MKCCAASKTFKPPPKSGKDSLRMGVIAWNRPSPIFSIMSTWDLFRAVEAVRLLRRIRLERPELWKQIVAFARGR